MNQESKDLDSHFADRLAAAVRRVGNPVMVGIDPRASQLPDGLRPTSGASLEEQAAAYAAFSRSVIDVVAPLVAIIKPQAAFFEQLGPPGMVALKQVIDYAQQRGLLVVVDGKRNDIGTTATAYAQAYLGRGSLSPWGADALTVNPYLGDDSLKPFIETASQRGAGIFVLVKTSNPGSGDFQDLTIDGRPLYSRVGARVEELSRRTAGSCGYGVAGAVVGATYPQQIAELRGEMKHTWFLIPGYGSQGAAAKDVAAAFDSQGLGAVVNNSRGIIFAFENAPYRERFGHREWQSAVEAATRNMIAQLAAETPAGRLVSK